MTRRPAAVLDTETTGPRPERDRIVQVGLVLIEADGLTHELGRLINPGCPIPPEATEIHGITDADVAGEPTFLKVARSLRDLLAGRDLIGFGISRFDVPLLMAEFGRAGTEWEPDGAIVDTMKIYHRFFPRNLEAAVSEYCGEPHEGAHDALSDARAALSVLEAQVARHELPEALDELEAFIADPAAVDRYGKLRRGYEGAICMNVGKYEGLPVAGLPRDYLEWVLKPGSFPSSVQRIVAEAVT